MTDLKIIDGKPGGTPATDERELQFDRAYSEYTLFTSQPENPWG